MECYNSKIEITAQRPCLVNGRRAIFHCWSVMARCVPPKGMTEEETEERFQHTTTRALVEYEDGTMGRPWPSEVRFLDGGVFDKYDWDAMERRADMVAEQAEETKDCSTCDHHNEEPAFTCTLCVDHDSWERSDGRGNI